MLISKAIEVESTNDKKCLENFLILKILFKKILGNIHKLGRLLTHEWWTVVDKEGKSKERYLFLFKARILICKVRRISDDRSVFILKDIIRLPEAELKDCEDLKVEFKSVDGLIVLIAHTEETKKIWLREIKQYLTDAVALQEHSIDDLKIDPKQHLDTIEPSIKLPQRIEAYETNQNVKPSDVAENYTVSKFSTKKASEEITSKSVTSLKETIVKTEESSQTITSAEEKQVKNSKIPVFKKLSAVEENISVKQEVTVKETPKVENKIEIPKEDIKNTLEEKPRVEEKLKVEKTKVEEKLKVEEKPRVEEKFKVEEKPKVEEKLKVEEKPKVEEKLKVVEKPKVVDKIKVEEKKQEEEKPKSLPELKTEIVRKSPVELPPVVSLEKSSVKEISETLPVKKSELSEVEQSVSDKLDKLSQKLKAIRKTEIEKEVTKLIPKELQEVTEIEKKEEVVRKQEAIREEIQEKIEEDYISENSVIRRIEERYKRNYKERYQAKSKKSLVEDELEIPKQPKSKPEPIQIESTVPIEKVAIDINKENLSKVSKAADTQENTQQTPPNKSQDNSQDNQQSNNQQPTKESDNNQNNLNRRGSGGSRKSGRDPSPPSPGAIKLPGFFDPPPPTQYEASIEVHVKKEKYPDPPPKITRKVIIKNEELEKKTEEFLKGEIPYEKEDYSLSAAQAKIKNLKHNLGKTTDTIKFAEDTVSKAILGDFSHIKTPGTVVPIKKKDPIFEYQYTVEDPKTGLCITTSEAVDFEDAEEELKKLAEMDADHQNKQSKRVEGNFCNKFSEKTHAMKSSYYCLSFFFCRNCRRQTIYMK